QPITQKYFKEFTSAVTASILELTGIAESNSRKVQLLIGSSLPNFANGFFSINGEKFSWKGEVSNPSEKNLSSHIPEFALRFLNAPYLWGGRSLFGIDCSGFTNVVFKLTG